MTTKPLVHYHASGNGSLHFDCLTEAAREHLDSRYDAPPAYEGGPPTTRYRIAAPKRHTDLRYITCPRCQRAIRALMQRMLERA